MKKIMILLMVSLILALLLLSGCKKPVVTPVSETACSIDSDCACGTHITTGDCFLGNKAFVNTEKQCPDFCTGIDGRFRTKCIEGECKNIRLQPDAECTTDADCVPAECCHPTSCKPGNEQPECAAVSCTAECRSGTIDCGGSCNCNNGKCIAKLNDL